MIRRPRTARPPQAAPVSLTPVIFTIASANYLAHAATLMQSVRAHHLECTRIIVLADAARPFAAIDLAAELLPVDALGIALIDNMKLWYSCIEFNTAIKPYAFRHFFAQGAQTAIYLDPDIELFAPLDAVIAGLVDHSVVLTPHITQPLPDDAQPDDHTILKAGVYNLGFLALRRDEDAARLLDWWAGRTFLHCRVDIAANLFTDQRWMDLAPCLVERACILRDPTYNVAYWNVAHRRVDRPAPGQWTVDGRRLVFFHFSGLQPDDPIVFSRYQTRFTMGELGPIAELCANYRAHLVGNAWPVLTQMPYEYGRFDNGRPIEAPMRRWLLRAADEARLNPALPLTIDPDYFDQPDETAAARGIVMTRMMYQLWLDRPDLRDVFDIGTSAGLDFYLAWFTGVDAATDQHSVAAAIRLCSGSTKHENATVLPWDSVAGAAWSGPARDAGQFLQGDLWAHIGVHDVLLPRQAALLWELRADLRQAYRLHNLDRMQDFIGWALTAGCAEAGIDPAGFSEAFVAQQTLFARPATGADDVPITVAMRATGRVALRRDYLNHWEQFPQDRLGRLSHGLWFAYVAPAQFGWPASLVAPVRAWFDELSTLRCGDFVFNRAELALWELRPDLQALFPLTDQAGGWGYLHWLCVDGLHELNLSLDAFDPRLRRFLSTPSSRMFGLSCAVEMIYHARADLRAAFDVQDETGRAGLHRWIEQYFCATFGDRPLGIVRAPGPTAAAAPLCRVELALVGQWHAPSGRGEDLRGSAVALDAVGFSDYVVLNRDSGEVWHADGTPLPAGTRIAAATAIVHLNADTALQDWLFMRRHFERAERVIGFWAWELEFLPQIWRHAFSFYDEIWASTNFARAAFEQAGLRPVRLMPMTVTIPPGLGEHPPQSRDAGETRFMFMFDFRSFVSRKNPDGVVRAFQLAFPAGDERVRLVIKTQGADSASPQWRRLRARSTDPRIEWHDTTLNRPALLALLAGADVFVSLHRSEGFGRGPAEAMLLGRPVIATGYSGTADFITADCAFVVPHTLRPVAPDEYPGVEGQSWADPDLDAAALLMRQCHENPQAAAELGRRGAARVQQLYNPIHVGHAMLAALHGIKPEGPPGGRRSRSGSAAPNKPNKKQANPAF